MVDKVKITEWVHALESGNYSQTRNMLRDNEGYCCIGVLGAINGVDMYNHRYGAQAYSLCDKITGMDNQLFWNMNDSKEMTFKEIASEIRIMFNIQE